MDICQAANSQPSAAHSGRHGPFRPRKDSPWPRASIASDAVNGPVDRTFRWSNCPARHGANATPSPATAAPTGPAPSWRASAYPPMPVSAGAVTNSTL